MKYISALLLLATALSAQDAPQTPVAIPGAPAPGAFGAGRLSDPEPKPYDKVITKDAVSKKGVFTIHTIKSKYYYEIPTHELGKDFLWSARLPRPPSARVMADKQPATTLFAGSDTTNASSSAASNMRSSPTPKIPLPKPWKPPTTAPS